MRRWYHTVPYLCLCLCQYLPGHERATEKTSSTTPVGFWDRMSPRQGVSPLLLLFLLLLLQSASSWERTALRTYVILPIPYCCCCCCCWQTVDAIRQETMLRILNKPCTHTHTRFTVLIIMDSAGCYSINSTEQQTSAVVERCEQVCC